MRIQLRGIYTLQFSEVLEKKLAQVVLFFSWDEEICTALVPIYKLYHPTSKVFQYLDKSSEVFDL